jgi:hypothetical protein
LTKAAAIFPIGLLLSSPEKRELSTMGTSAEIVAWMAFVVETLSEDTKAEPYCCCRRRPNETDEKPSAQTAKRSATKRNRNLLEPTMIDASLKMQAASSKDIFKK